MGLNKEIYHPILVFTQPRHGAFEQPTGVLQGNGGTDPETIAAAQLQGFRANSMLTGGEVA